MFPFFLLSKAKKLTVAILLRPRLLLETFLGAMSGISLRGLRLD
jgi:hypothetical protein